MAEATPPTEAALPDTGPAEAAPSGASPPSFQGRAALGVTPIPGASPAGEPPNDLPEFEQLRDEATRDPVQGPPDWEAVASLGEKLLRESAKDFVVASYTGVAFAQTGGVEGLHDGLTLLDGMLRTFWEDGSPPIPKRMRARANALQWYAEKTAAWLERATWEAADLGKLEASLAVASALSDVLSEKFPPDVEVGVGPILSALRDSTKRLAQDAAASPLAPAPGPSPAGPAPMRATSAPAAPGASAGGGVGEIATRQDAVRAVRQVARFLREQDAASAEALALVRLMAWSQVKAPPPNQDGKTMLPPPDRGAVQNAVGGAPGDLLAATENAFASAPMWLDLQRHAVEALDAMGPAHRVARDFLVGLVRDLVNRVPALPGLQFQDGSDFADAATRQWIADVVLADAGGAGTSAPAPAAEVDAEALRALRSEAVPLVQKGRLGAVQERLAALFADDPSPRARFHERLELATLCFEAGRERVALGLLDGLEREIGLHELDRWDPALAARALVALYRAHVKVLGKNPTPEQAARREELFGRLCRIDPVQAAAVD